MWSWWLVETHSGVPQTTVDVVSPSWGRKYNSAGRTRATVSTARWEVADARRLLEPYAMSLVPHWNGEPVVYAPILKSSRAGEDLVSLECVDILDLADYRFLQPVQASGREPYAFSGLSTSGAIVRVLRDAFDGNDWARQKLPLDSTGAVTTGSVSRSIPQHEWQTVGDVLRELQNTEGAPSVELRPVKTADGNIQLRIELSAGLVGGTTAEYVVPSGSEVVDWSWQIDATKQVTGVAILGEGSGEDMLDGRAAYTSPEYNGPFRQRAVPMKNISNQAQLTNHAFSYRDAHNLPTTQFSLTVRIGQIVPSRPLRAIIRVYPMREKLIEERWYECVLVGMSGDGSENVKLELQEAR